MSAIFVGSFCQWLSLVAASGDPVIIPTNFLTGAKQGTSAAALPHRRSILVTLPSVGAIP